MQGFSRGEGCTNQVIVRLILPPDLSVSFPIEQTVNLFDFWRRVRIWSNQYAGVIIIDIVSSLLILCDNY